uniref:Uncharacterized protein n=1 Tax=Parascaris univalens TaxID=6257 RepID=A0A915CGQ5_PARUN
MVRERQLKKDVYAICMKPQVPSDKANGKVHRDTHALLSSGLIRIPTPPYGDQRLIYDDGCVGTWVRPQEPRPVLFTMMVALVLGCALKSQGKVSVCMKQ